MTRSDLLVGVSEYGNLQKKWFPEDGARRVVMSIRTIP